jgi:PPOX class probable F420-dependent enzyme
MDAEEVASFLAAGRKVQVASLGREGAPHLTTLFYVLRDGRIAFWTYRGSQKVRNLERDARVSCLVEAGEEYGELRGVSVRGRAEVLREADQVLDVGTAVAARMAGVTDLADLGDLAAPAVAEVTRQAAKRVAVVVHPEHVASWDHRKLHG